MTIRCNNTKQNLLRIPTITIKYTRKDETSICANVNLVKPQVDTIDVTTDSIIATTSLINRVRRR